VIVYVTMFKIIVNMLKSKYLVSFLLVISLVSFTKNSLASVSSVSNADVKQGSGKIITRTAFVEDETKGGDNLLFTRYGASYGFTEYFGLELITNQENPSDDSWEHENYSFRLNFQYLESENNNGFDAGVRLTYDMADNDKGSDELEARFKHKYAINDEYEFRNNVIIEHEFGPAGTSGLQGELRFQLTKKFDLGEYGIGAGKQVKIGLESFHDFKNLRFVDEEWDQDHEIGPIISGNLTKSISFQTGFLYGLSEDSPRMAWRLFLNQKF